MQVVSTLLPDIKSQKISEHRFRLKQTECSPRTQLKPLKTAGNNVDQTRQLRTAHQKKVGGVWHLGLAGRPPWSAVQAHGSHRLNLNTWRLLTGCLGRFQELQLVARSYKYKGRG